jgi:hypothetical protein
METMKEDVNALNSRGGWDKFKNGTMLFTKYGDAVTCLFGGIPVYKYHYDKVLKETGSVKLAEAMALREWEKATESTQQSGEKTNLSMAQRNPYLRMFTMYKTQSFQYHRKVTAAWRNLEYGKAFFHRDPIRGTRTANFKNLMLYHVALPMMFQFVANGLKFDWEDELQAGLLGNLNEVFIAGDAFDYIMGFIRGLPFDYQATPIESTINTVAKAGKYWKQANIIKAIFDEEENISTQDLIKAVENTARATGDYIGVPIDFMLKTEKTVEDVATGQTNYPVRRVLGWSERTMDDANSLIFKDKKEKSELENLINDTANPTFYKIFDLEDKKKGAEKKKSVAPVKKGTGKIPNF